MDFWNFHPYILFSRISGDELKTSQLKQLELTGLEKDGKQYGMIPIKYTFDEFSNWMWVISNIGKYTPN